jgi:hypothetical protein
MVFNLGVISAPGDQQTSGIVESREAGAVRSGLLFGAAD